jgi:hypothetical protein
MLTNIKIQAERKISTVCADQLLSWKRRDLICDAKEVQEEEEEEEEEGEKKIIIVTSLIILCSVREEAFTSSQHQYN